jgi:hypothetical protein
VGEWAPRDPQRRKEHHELLEKLLGFYDIPLTTRCGSGIGYGNGSCVSQ